MLQVFDDQGQLRGATAIEVGPCWVTQVRTEEKDGYSAVQLGFGEKKRLNQPASGHLAASGAPNLRHLAEFRVTGEVNLGDQIGVEIFEQGELVDVTAKSKGRGFQGGVKRHHFRGGPKTHGQSDRHRAPRLHRRRHHAGAACSRARAWPGTWGAARTTVRNLEVVGCNEERGVIFVAGTVPGPPGGLVRVRHARAVAGSRGKA